MLTTNTPGSSGYFIGFLRGDRSGRFHTSTRNRSSSYSAA